jgi:hypothetical protein
MENQASSMITGIAKTPQDNPCAQVDVLKNGRLFLPSEAINPCFMGRKDAAPSQEMTELSSGH